MEAVYLGGRIGAPPIALGHAWSADPDLPDATVGNRCAGGGVDDRDGRPGHGRPAQHEVDRSVIDRRQQVTALDAAEIGRQRAHLPPGGGRDDECRLGHAVGGDHGRRVQSCSGEPARERLDRGGLDGFGSGDDVRERRQIEFGELLVGDHLRTQAVGEVGGDGEGAAVLRDEAQPHQRPTQKARGRGEDGVDPGVDRPQQQADEPHVVIVRQPPHPDRVGAVVHGRPDRLLVGDEVAVRHDDALGHTGGSGCVLQQSDAVRGDLRCRPGVGQREVGLAELPHERRPEVGLVEQGPGGGVGQHEACPGVGGDRLDAFDHAPRVAPDRDGNRRDRHAGVEGGVHRLREPEARFEAEHSDVSDAESETHQLDRPGPRPLVEFGVAPTHRGLLIGVEADAAVVTGARRGGLHGIEICCRNDHCDPQIRVTRHSAGRRRPMTAC